MTRRSHEPLWVKSLFDFFNRLYVQHYIKPQFDHVGIGLQIIGPRHLQLTGGNITAGNHVHFMALKDKPVRLSIFETSGAIHIGDYSIVNPGVRITSAAQITIGHSCMLAMNVYLSDADWHDIQHRIFAPGKTRSIILGNNVWIGDSAIVCKGVQIGDNSVVGAGSIVTKNVPANTIVAGNPAKVIGKVDPNNLSTREHLFNSQQPYSEFVSDYNAVLLGKNTFFKWLQSLLQPSKKH